MCKRALSRMFGISLSDHFYVTLDAGDQDGYGLNILSKLFKFFLFIFKGATSREFCGFLAQIILRLVLANLIHSEYYP